MSVDGAYEIDKKLGMVTRSFRHDRRNKKPYTDWPPLNANDLMEDEPMYTSLWFDAVKPTTCDYVISPRTGEILPRMQ